MLGGRRREGRRARLAGDRCLSPAGARRRRRGRPGREREARALPATCSVGEIERAERVRGAAAPARGPGGSGTACPRRHWERALGPPEARLAGAAPSLVLELHFQPELETDTREARTGAHKGSMETGTGKPTLGLRVGGRRDERGTQGSALQRRAAQARTRPPRWSWLHGLESVLLPAPGESGTPGRSQE